MAAGFEVIVRPVVFPDIRPAPSRSVAPEDDPEKDFAVISGSSGTFVSLPNSWSQNATLGRLTETERRDDEVRVFQKEDSGTINRDNFVDLSVANRISMRGSRQIFFYSRVKEQDHIHILRKDVIKRKGT